MQKRVPEVWDVKEQVVGAMCRDKGIIVELFQRCGRDEFIFIRRSGLYFGFLFGIFQMVQWLVWDPWWSLAVGGAAVGYATNWLALTLMFSPVNPIEFGPFTLHGAFLRRQAEVSVEFAEMLRDRVLTAELIWREILTSERTKGVFAEILERKTREQIRKARAEGGMVALAAGVLGEKAWRAAEDAAATPVPRRTAVAPPARVRVQRRGVGSGEYAQGKDAGAERGGVRGGAAPGVSGGRVDPHPRRRVSRTRRGFGQAAFF